MKKFVFYLVMLAFTLCLVELCAFAISKLVDPDDFFDSREVVFARLNEADLAEFKAKSADPVTGWNWHGPLEREEANCIGEMIHYHYDAAGARMHPLFDPASSEVVVVGDSYTNGDEVGDSETFPARLSGLLGVSVANHGVGGYGPAQSLLNLQENIARYPQAKVAILVIMYENLYRMLNSYRPVLYTQSSDYSLKPYMADGHIVPHPGSQVFDSLDQFKAVAEQAFDHDFWAKPVARFPYTLALGKSLASNYFYYRKLQRAVSRLGKPEYFLIFNADEIRLNLIALLNEYAVMARSWNVQPVVIFVPRNRLDTSSASKFIEQHRAELDAGLIIGDVAEYEGVDWVKFNLQEKTGNNICHPSPYGYQTIAEYIAQLLREQGVWPPT
ncbi:MAG: hypothetical protein R3E50_16475 [Halioglobus sp.]